METINYKNIALQGIIDTQLKLKILYSLESQSDLSQTNKQKIQSISLKLIYSTSLKKVLSSKSSNRIIKNFFKVFYSSLSRDPSPTVKKNKTALDNNYTATVAIKNLYDIL